MSPNPISMTTPARNDNTTAAKQVVIFFLRSTPPSACSRTRPPLERPAFAKANNGTVSLSRPMSGRKAGRSMSGRQKRDAQCQVETTFALMVVESPKKKDHHLFRRRFVVIFGRNHRASTVRCLYVLVYQG